MSEPTTESPKPKLVHEPEHKPVGDPCAKCGLKASRHKVRRGRKRNLETKKRRRATDSLLRQLHREKRNAEPLVAIDGEGKGRFPHLYTYMAAVDEHGDKRGSVADPEGLATIDCLNFLLDLGVPRVFGFSLGYDFSMMLKDLPDALLYMLVRPERRSRTLETGRTVHRPVYWRGFKLTYMRRRLGIQRVAWSAEKGKNIPQGPGVVVWDVFAFYQGKFTKALGDWKVGAEVLEKISSMKDERSNFDKMSEKDIQDYCDLECHLLGKLVRLLIESHETANLPLHSFYGAGSTASVLLTRMGVKDYIAEPPAEALDYVTRAFFGGRFELSMVGPIEDPCWNHDISSAYPYELWKLPCLIHGRWRLVTGSPTDVDRAVRSSRLAVVHCEIKGSGPKCWGPLPFRVRRTMSLPADQDLAAGTILFPLKSEGSWCWKEEYLAAHDTLWPGVIAKDAWCYHTDCDCRPFEELPLIYAERVRIGKEGPGIVLKLGPNSCYGKTAQSVGSAPFRSWVWAGCVTSGTRAQILRAIAAAKDPRNILMVATDGILAREQLSLPEPEDTGTSLLEGPADSPKDRSQPCPDCHKLCTEKQHTCIIRKPLGGWEVTGKTDKKAPKPVFLARPGIYWPLHATKDELLSIKARGISRSVLAERAAHIEKHFRTHGWRTPYVVDSRCIPCDLPTPFIQDPKNPARKLYRNTCPKCGAKPSPPCVRFVGVRQGIDCDAAGRALLAQGKPISNEHCTRRDTFGEWVEWPLEVTFRPAPKRVTVRKDMTLECWERYPGGGVSAPYNKAHVGAESLALQQYKEMIEEQPDCDLTLD